MRRKKSKTITDLFHGLEIVIGPNESNEIWIRDSSSMQMVRITAGKGRAGMSLTVKAQNFTGGDNVTRISDKDYNQLVSQRGTKELSLVLYDNTEEARQFCDWYDGKTSFYPAAYAELDRQEQERKKQEQERFREELKELARREQMQQTEREVSDE